MAARFGVATPKSFTGTADMYVDDTFEFTLGSSHFKIIHTPGHTPGSVCYYAKEQNICFTGDTLFARGIGRTDGEGGSKTQIQNSICELR